AEHFICHHRPERLVRREPVQAGAKADERQAEQDGPPPGSSARCHEGASFLAADGGREKLPSIVTGLRRAVLPRAAFIHRVTPESLESRSQAPPGNALLARLCLDERANARPTGRACRAVRSHAEPGNERWSRKKEYRH